MEYPGWVLSHKRKGTAIERHGNNYYLREVSSVWDKDKHRAKKISGKYLGKITVQGLVPPKYETVLRKLTDNGITVKEYGATRFLTDLNKDIIDLIKKHFPSDWKEIFVFAMFRLMYNSPIKNLTFLNTTSFIYDTINADMNDRLIGRLLRELGTERGVITEFLSNFVTEGEYLAVDLTHVFSLSENIVSSMTGYNSKRDFAPQVNLLYLFNLTRRMPAYFRTVVGSISSVSSLSRSIKESGAKDVVLVGDKGFYSANNIKELEKEGLHYILPLKRDSSLIDYNIVRSGDMRKFNGHFVFEKRPIHYYSYSLNKRKVFLFLDDRLKTEEMKDAIQRTNDEERSKENQDKSKEQFYEMNHRMGTIAVITDLQVAGGEEVYSFLKQRINIEQLYDTFKNTLEADRSYMRDDYQLEGWMFINFVAILLYYKVYNLLVNKKALKKYSIKDVLLHLERVHKLKIDNVWITSEIPKKTTNLLEKLEIHITND